MIIVFESHSTTIDNEAGVASGWNDVTLSPKGEEQARELGGRYKLDDFDAVYCADLQRAYKTAQLAFPNITSKRLFLDWRLRECDYGDLTLAASEILDADKVRRVDTPFPNGESYAQAMTRMKSFIDDLKTHPKYNKILIIGSRATHYGLDVWLDGRKIEDLLVKKMIWQPGWTYELLPEEDLAKTRAVCNVVLEEKSKYLLVQEKQPHVYGKWNFPGGHVDQGETLEETAIREALEETNFEIKIIKQLLVHHPLIGPPVLHAYSAEIIGGQLKYPPDEILDARWFSFQEIMDIESELRDSVYIIGAIKVLLAQ